MLILAQLLCSDNSPKKPTSGNNKSKQLSLFIISRFKILSFWDRKALEIRFGTLSGSKSARTPIGTLLGSKSARNSIWDAFGFEKRSKSDLGRVWIRKALEIRVGTLLGSKSARNPSWNAFGLEESSKSLLGVRIRV